MARSFRPKNGEAQNFQGPVITGGAGADFGGAASSVNMGASYGSLRASSPDYTGISATSQAARANERATIMQAEASVAGAGLKNLAAVKSAKIQADAAKDAAEAQARGSMIGSAFGAIGSIGGAMIGLSDESTKENINRIEDALTTLRQLQPVTFNYKEEWSSNSERQHNGFIAQEYKKVLPDATYYDESTSKFCIDTGELIGLLVRAVQQLEIKVMRLEGKKILEGAK